MMILIPSTGATPDERIEYNVGSLYKSLFKRGFDNEHTALADSKATFRSAKIHAVPMMRSGVWADKLTVTIRLHRIAREIWSILTGNWSGDSGSEPDRDSESDSG